MVRRGRPSSARANARSRRTSTPAAPQEDASDDQMEVTTPDAADEEQVPTPAPESDHAEDEPSNPPTPQPAPLPKKRGPGRPPKVRPIGWDTPDANGDDASDSGTPRGRRRGRPSLGGRGGFRGRGRKGAQSLVTRVPIDKEGNTLEVVDDEVAVEANPEGETKVDKNGVLQGGREYRVRVFTTLGRGDRLYMLSTEPARCTGYRDSYLFFTKHMTLFKILIGEEEKLDLIDRELLPHSYKGRQIGVVTARSVFREFGARIVVGGRKVTDDYYVDRAKARGDVEGELADQLDRLPEKGQDYNRNQYVAWHGASSVYHSSQPNLPMQNSRPLPGKRKTAITSVNWMLEHAREAARFNSALASQRRATSNGVYDPHTNLKCYPKNMQPTHARWERIAPGSDREPSAKRRKANGLTNGIGSHVNGADHDDDLIMINGATSNPLNSAITPSFPPVSDLISNNFLVIDSYFQSPPSASWPTPGPSPFTKREEEKFDIVRPGVPELTEEQWNDLPEECRQGLSHARKEIGQWRNSWRGEARNGGRGSLRIGVGST